jgi:hypothetical protein
MNWRDAPMSDALSGLTGAYGNGLLQQDPAYMPALQKLALARSLLGQGLSDAPARPTQGLSRIAAALLGSYEMNQGNQSVQDTMQQRQQAAMGAYNNAMSPLGSAMLGAPPPSLPSGQGMPPAPPASSASPTIQTAPLSAQAPSVALASPTASASALSPIVHQLESSGSAAPGIRGDGGAAAGPMQVHQAALTDVNRAQGTHYTLDQLAADPQLGQRVGDMYLTLQQQRFPGRPDLALAAYNAGPTATANAGGPGVAGVPAATAPYVAKGEAMLGGAQSPDSAGGAPSAAPQTGLNNPNIMRAFQMHQAALKMVLADPYNAQTRQLAQGLEQTSQMLMGMDTFAPGPNGTQVNARTGEIKYPPVGRVVTDSAGNVISVDAGGASHIVSPANVPGAAALAGGKAGAEAAAKDQWHAAIQNGVQGQINSVTGEFRPVAPQPHYEQSAPGIYSDTSGTHAPSFAPTPRPYTTVGGVTGAVGPGGQNTILSDNPSGMSGNSPEANAMRTMANLAPIVKSGQATPQQMANYATAADTWRAPSIHADPASGALVRLNTRELPPDFPEPPSIGQGGTSSSAGGSAVASTIGVPLTGSSRGPAAAQAITEDQGKNDAAEISKNQATVMQGHNVLSTTATIRAMAPQVTTGVGADARLRASQIFTSLGVPPDTVQSWTGTGAAPGEILQKKLFELSTGAERQMGAREPGSVMTLFMKNYPNMSSQNMTIDAMTRLIDMDQAYKENEIAGRQQYFNQQVQGVAANKPYGGLSGYQQPDPRIYQAAALASGGMPFSAWSQGLPPAQQADALRLAAKVYGPSASALDAKGVRHTFQAPQSPPPAQGGTGGG